MKKYVVILCLLTMQSLLCMNYQAPAELKDDAPKKVYRAAIKARDFGEVLTSYREIRPLGGSILIQKGIMPFVYIYAPESIVKKTFNDTRIVSLKLIPENEMAETVMLANMYAHSAFAYFTNRAKT